MELNSKEEIEFCEKQIRIEAEREEAIKIIANLLGCLNSQGINDSYMDIASKFLERVQNKESK